MQGPPGRGVFTLRCPACHHLGSFEEIGQDIGFAWENRHCGAGQRRCPNTNCRAHLFVLYEGGAIVVSYPAERIDFDTTGIPGDIVESLDEAITCHANRCYTAAAIMVRKTLEALCHARNAPGGSLAARIKALGQQALLPPELLDGLDDLRLLGNDAAHYESTAFNQVGPAEVATAIKFTKAVLQAVYQYATLLDELRGLRRAQQT
jgi:hypothetical protein